MTKKELARELECEREKNRVLQERLDRIIAISPNCDELKARIDELELKVRILGGLIEERKAK